MSADPSWRIYSTAKTRMLAESRCRRIALILNLSVAWYTLWIIVLSIYDLKATSDNENTVGLVVLSVIVFALSLVVPGLALEEKASRHRECYLRLQRLEADSLQADTKLQRYFDILEGYPNHSDLDWDLMLVSAAMRKEQLTNSRGLVQASCWQWMKAIFYYALSYLAVVAAFSIPVFAFFKLT